jgi:hypothetical protein
LGAVHHKMQWHPSILATGLQSHKRMKAKNLTIPEIILIAGTRVALGAGIGLLISDKLNNDERRGEGRALLGFGILTTIPIAMGVIGKPFDAERALALAS